METHSSINNEGRASTSTDKAIEKRQRNGRCNPARQTQRNSQASSTSAKQAEGKSKISVEEAHIGEGADAHQADASTNSGDGEGYNKSAYNPATKKRGELEPSTLLENDTETKNPGNSELEELKQAAP